MAISLEPQTQNGIIIWKPSTLILHLLWAWQFMLACAGEVFLLFGIKSIEQDIAGSSHHPSPIWLWVFFILTLLLVITVIAEICLYANAQLSSNLYFALQTVKLLYAVLVFGLFLAFSSIPGKAYFRQFVVGILIYWPPWLLSFTIATLIQLTPPPDTKQKAAQNVEAPSERAPLLPSQIPSPRHPSQRVAVQRYPS